jgi:hypothetical protein
MTTKIRRSRDVGEVSDLEDHQHAKHGSSTHPRHASNLILNLFSFLVPCTRLINALTSFKRPRGCTRTLTVFMPRTSTNEPTPQVLQRITLAEHTDLLPVSPARQQSAFPPNFVHSLDSTHMFSSFSRCCLSNSCISRCTGPIVMTKREHCFGRSSSL